MRVYQHKGDKLSNCEGGFFLWKSNQVVSGEGGKYALLSQDERDLKEPASHPPECGQLLQCMSASSCVVFVGAAASLPHQAT